MEKILLVGRYPPPLGGISVHIERLAKRSALDGYDVSVLDIYGGEAPIELSPSTLSLYRRRTGFGGALEVCNTLRQSAPGAIVHFHISAGARFYVLAPVLLSLTRQARKRILTIHSGSWVDEFDRLSWVVRELATRALSGFEDIICVNDAQRSRLFGTTKSNIHVIPAYLPSVDLEPLTDMNVIALSNSVDILVVTSGYGTPTYDFETVLSGLELAQHALGLSIGLVIATYSVWDDDYWQRVVERCSKSSVATALTRNLTPGQFAQLLSMARIYVRGTLFDGDAVAIREAASAGCQVVASDSILRPDGTALFKTGDARGLADCVVQAVEGNQIGRLRSDATQDNYLAIRRVYGA